MLRKLASLFCDDKEQAPHSVPLHGAIDFKGMLAAAVEAKGTSSLLLPCLKRLTRFPVTLDFSPDSIPAQEWCLDSHGVCNNSAPVRSILAFGLGHQNAAAVNNWDYRGNEGFRSMENKFTHFGPKPPATSAAATVLDAVPPGVNKETCFINLEDSLQAPGDTVRKRRELVENGLNNLLGLRPTNDPICNVIADILGSDSKAGKSFRGAQFSDILPTLPRSPSLMLPQSRPRQREPQARRRAHEQGRTSDSTTRPNQNQRKSSALSIPPVADASRSLHRSATYCPTSSSASRTALPSRRHSRRRKIIQSRSYSRSRRDQRRLHSREHRTAGCILRLAEADPDD